jgi:hypothetical protein
LIVAFPAAVSLASTYGAGPERPGIHDHALTYDVQDEVGSPASSVDSGPAGPTNAARPIFGFSSPDGSATFACSIDTGIASFGACSGADTHQPPSNLLDGSYTFRVKATDPAGNSTTATRLFSVDTQAPPASIDSGPTGPTNDARPTFGFSSPDGSATFACSIDTGIASFGACSGANTHRPPSNLLDGSYTFRVKATDPAGNSTTATRTFQLDSARPHLDARGRLLDASDLSVDANPEVEVDAADAGSGVTSIGLLVDDRRADQLVQACPDGGCELQGTLQPDLSAIGLGWHSYEIVATDGAANTAHESGTFSLAAKSNGGVPSGTPSAVPAWYMTATNRRDLKLQAAHDACAFARGQPNKTRVLLLDFGKAELYEGRFGTQLRTGPHFSDVDVLEALKAGADAYRSNRPCYRRGSVRITYGNTNNMPTTMDNEDTRKAGRHQAQTAHRLRAYQRRQGGVYNHQGVAVAGDIEPQWNPPGITKALVAGAANGLGGLYLNYGAATNCPPQGSTCANNWDFDDLGTVSFGGVRRPLPEMYQPWAAEQWTHVRRHWNTTHGSRYCFYGATATPGFPLSPAEGWRSLRARNPCVKRELVNIRDN